MFRFLKLVLCGVTLSGHMADAATLRVGRTAGAPSLGNPFATVGAPSSGVWAAMFDGLTQIGDSGQLEPALALSWRAEAPTRWIFTLRPDVVFHNGATFTAESVVNVVQWLQSDAGRRFYVAGELTGITGLRALGPLTLEVTTARPDPLLPKRFNLVYMVEPGAWHMLGPDGFARTPVGTGPFQLQRWGADRIVFKRAPSWRVSESVSELELVLISDASVRLQALQSGAIDLLEGLSPDDVAAVDRERFTVDIKPMPAVLSLAFRNVGNPASPVQDRRVREAMNIAIDRTAIARDIAGDVRLAATQGAVAGVIGFDPELPAIPFDPGRARALLADAGFPEGFDLEIEVMTGFGGNDQTIYQKVAEDLRAVGIRVALREIPYQAWLGKYLQNDWGAVDVFSFMWDSSIYYDVVRPLRNSSCSRANPFFCLPDLMPLVDDSDIEMNKGARDAKMRVVGRRMRDDWGAIWLTTSVARMAMHKGVEDVHLRSSGLAYERIRLRSGGRP